MRTSPIPEKNGCCEACGVKTTMLRRGRCPICYLRWADERPVGLGAQCVICGDKRHQNLRSAEFQSRWLPMCHCCSARAFRLSPMPRSIEGVRQKLSRDRRWMEQRVGRRDGRLYPGERRAGERREPAQCVSESNYIGKAECLDASDLVIEIVDHDKNSEFTRIARF